MPASSHATSFTSPDTSSSSVESTFVDVPTLANPTTHLSSSGIATLISIGTQTQSSAPAFSTPNGLDGGNPDTAKPLSTLQSLAAESTLLLPSGDVSSSVTQRLHTAQASPSPSASLPPGGLSTALPTPSGPHHPNIGEIIAIILGALALLFCIAFVVLFFLHRRARARRKARRTYSGSPWQRIKPHIYDESSSRPESSIWTWFGSIPIDTEYTAQPEPQPYSPESHLSEKGAGPSAASERLDASSPRPSPCPSPTPTETRPLARDASSAHSLHEDPPYLTVPISSAPEASSSSKLLALSGTEYAVANPFSDVHEVRIGRSVSGVSHTTTSSGDVQSVEAL